MFGRYAFRTGVLDNGCGAAATPQKEVSLAKTLQQAGYATALVGKWSQLAYLDTAEEGRAWGFDEFLRWDKSQGERYWKPALNKNGQPVPVTDASYGPDLQHEFVVDFITRHRDRPFFVYYPTPLIHGPILRTPDSQAGGEQRSESQTPGRQSALRRQHRLPRQARRQTGGCARRAEAAREDAHRVHRRQRQRARRHPPTAGPWTATRAPCSKAAAACRSSRTGKA